MVYKAFQETITSRLQSRLGTGYRLIVSKVPKNNGLFLDGLTITLRDQTASPVIYLNYYYERFLGGHPIDSLVEEIVDIYRESAGILHADFSILNDFERLKDRITYRVISTRDNLALLKDTVSVPFQDLSIVFYLFLQQSPIGQMTALVRRRHMEQWRTTPEELLALAEKNTPLLLPPELKNMDEIMDAVAREHMGDDYYPGVIDTLFPDHAYSPLYVLSNTTGLHGACVMLYPDVLKNFADRLDRDLVILPSSIHEVLLLPYDDNVTFSGLSDMVAEINQTAVSLEDRLSNHVYFYSRTADEIILAQDSASAYVS